MKIRVRDVAKATADHFDVPYSMLMGPHRQRKAVRARHIAMLVARRITGESLARIGQFIGGRDHTTVIHGIRKAQELLTPEHEAAIAKRIEALLNPSAAPVVVKDERYIEARCGWYCDERAFGMVTLADGKRAYLPRLALVSSRIDHVETGGRLWVSVRPGRYGLQVDQASRVRVREGAEA